MNEVELSETLQGECNVTLNGTVIGKATLTPDGMGHIQLDGTLEREEYSKFISDASIHGFSVYKAATSDGEY